MKTSQDATPAIKELHRQIVQDLVDLEDELADLTQRKEQMRSVVQNLDALYNGLPSYLDSENGSDSPRGKIAVERVLEENNGEWMSIKDITAEMGIRRFLDKGAKNPQASIRAALRRLSESPTSDLQQRKDGRSVLYRMKPQEQSRFP